jgi:hypothetical protein
MEGDPTKVSPWYQVTVHQVWDPWRIDGGIVTILLHFQFRYFFLPFPTLLYLSMNIFSFHAFPCYLLIHAYSDTA